VSDGSRPGACRARLRVRGRVQGVWFRGWTREQAVRLGVAGHARNLADGSVEVLAQGSREAVTALESLCRQGPPAARVDSVERSDEAPGPGLEGFGVE